MNKKTDFFGNKGKDLFVVPISFARKGVLFHFDLLVAADDEDEAREVAAKIPETAVGQIYFSVGRLANADEETTLSILKSIEGVSNVGSEHTGEDDFDFCVDENEADQISEGDDELVGDDDYVKEEEYDEDYGICGDDFGNEGEKFWWVPMEFAMETVEVDEDDEGEVKKFTFHLKIAADNEEDAIERAEEVSLHDITGDADDDECFCDMTVDDIVEALNTQYDSTCDADWENYDDEGYYLCVSEDEDVEECFI